MPGRLYRIFRVGMDDREVAAAPRAPRRSSSPRGVQELSPEYPARSLLALLHGQEQQCQQVLYGQQEAPHSHQIAPGGMLAGLQPAPQHLRKPSETLVLGYGHFTNNGNGTAVITGTPANGSSGRYRITITATNASGTTARAVILLISPHRASR